MCGICGIYGKEDKKLLKEMSKALSHRGPDQFGFFIDKKVCLGHRRLSIVDLTNNGKQPIHNKDNSMWIVFNGEIYNYLDIKAELEKKGHSFYSNTDTEVILHAYEEYGADCLNLFNGCFAFAIYDSKKKHIFLARDRLGIKPLYYTISNGVLYFASEIKSILVNKEIKREVNNNAFNSYFTFRANTDAETFFKGIFKLQPGHYMVYNRKVLVLKKYWDLQITPGHKSLNYYVKKTREELIKSIKMRLMGEVPLGVYLSGGIDSSAITGLLSSFSDNVKTFSVGFDEKNELSGANKIAEHFNTDHHTLTVKQDTVKLLPKIVYHQDEPMADPTSIPTYVLSEFTKRQGVTVALTGEGADEIFCGYEQYKLAKIWNYAKIVPRPLRALGPGVAKAMPINILNKFFKYAGQLGEKGIERGGKYLTAKDPATMYLEVNSIFDEEEKKQIMNCGFDYSMKKYLNSFLMRKGNLLDNMMNAEIKTALVENLLMKVDKNTMAHSVEARVPFLDHNVVEHAFRIPINYRMKGFTEKYVLRKAMQGILPKENIWAKKERFFVPIDTWMTQDLKDYMKQMLDVKTLGHNYFDKRYLDKISSGLRKSRLFYTRQLWTLLNFQIWHKFYIESSLKI